MHTFVDMLTHTHTHTHTHSLTCSHTHTLTCSHTHTHSLNCSHSLSLHTPTEGSLLDFANSSGLLFKRQANDFSSSNDQLPSSFSTSFPNGAHPPGEAPEYDDNYDPRNGNENLSPDLNSKGNNGFEDDNFTLVMSKGFRCSHIMAPIMIVTTPTIGDVDGDGKLEVSYTVVWSSPGDSMDGRQVPPKMKVSTFTMEDKFNEVYGEGVIDFRQFLPPEKQPWPRYMGATADCVYHPQHNLRDTRGQRS